MRLLYLSSVCAQSRFDRLVEHGYIIGQFQNQKFHHLLLLGLASAMNDDIIVISFYPQIRQNNLTHRYEQELEDGITYIYPFYIDRPILHHVFKFLGTYKALKSNYSSDTVIACNIMNFDECLAALLFRVFHKVKICAITADVPGITSGAGKNDGAWWKRKMNSLIQPLYKAMSKQYDAYMFLAAAMNDVVNPNNKPHIVVEGLADLSMQHTKNNLESKYPIKTVMYAGGLHKEYGIQLMVEAFRKLKEKDVELHIYGKGNYENELVKISKKDHRIKYFGTRSNSDIVEAQLKAHILINPRPTAAEFVKYSFPSKIMECMVSGTPLLTTCIPSMPQEYYPYLYTIEDETIEGFHSTLRYILSLPNKELHDKGKEAKKFIIKKKNYKVQAAKLYELLNVI